MVFNRLNNQVLMDVASCLRNVVSMFHILERETEWRRQNGKPLGFGAMRAFRPVVAVGAEDPLDDQKMLADYFRMLFAIDH